MSAGRVLVQQLYALLLLSAGAEETKRCTYGAAGDLVGHEIYLNNNVLQPTARRQYSYPVPALPGCALNGVSARVCDLFSPEVEVLASLEEVRVRRLGPRLRPVSLELSLYCDPLASPLAQLPHMD